MVISVHLALKNAISFCKTYTARSSRMGNSCWMYRRRALPSGFWKPGPHVVLEEGFNYSEQSIWLDQYTVIEADGKVSVYRNWFQDYTPESITAELAQGGLAVESLWGDLTGKPHTPDSEWIGLVTGKL